MKKFIAKHIFATILCSLALVSSTQAQELLYEVPLVTQINSSTQVVEGKVISKTSFWDANHQNIYTSNTIEVYKVYKGQSLSSIEIITRGGTVGIEAEIVTPSLQLDVNDMGIFTLENATMPLNARTNSQFQPFSDVQGFYKYNLFTNIAANIFKVKTGISDFYGEIMSLTNTNYVTTNDFDIDAMVNLAIQNRGAGEISSFSPSTTTAGKQTVLTIDGAGFGPTQQIVGFSNANDGGSTYVFALDTQVLSWSDTQVTVEIPTQAGTGTIAIINAAATAIVASSTSNLNITYSEINANFDPDNNGVRAYPTQHYDQNDNGGYTWQMFTDFDANTSAKASFNRAFDTWRCETGINWTLGDVSSVDVIADDEVNIIRFDNGSELASGTLGVCTSRLGGCYVGASTTEMEWLVTELDIVFNDTTNWQYGPTNANNSQIDFETVAVHELGHGHQLGHVIDTDKIMHYAIGGGTNNRALSSSDVDGANDVQSRSTTLMPCGAPVMIPLDCTTLSTDEFALSEGISIYPNPAKNILNISNLTYMLLDSAVIYDVQGRLISKIDINQSRGLTSIDISHVNSGLYLLKIKSNGIAITKKFIVE